MTWIIVALRALATWFWPSVGKSAPSGRSTAAGPLPEPSEGSREGAGTNLKHSPAEKNRHENLDNSDRTSQEQSDSGNIDGEKGNTESGASLPELSFDSASSEERSLGLDSTSGDQPPITSTEVESKDPASTALRDDDDQVRNLPETGGHSEIDEPGGTNEGSTSAEKPPKTNLKPRDIGGRRLRRHLNSKRHQRPRRPPVRPELICRKTPGSTTWEIILTVDEECKLLAVQLEDERLNHSARECRVPSFAGQLVVACQEEQQHSIPLFKDNPLIFKLRKNWLGEGRKIDGFTSGYFIVIAPTSWDRIGHVPVEPDGCADIAFRAHYFHREADATDEDLDGFREWSRLPVVTGIKLKGVSVFDDSDEGDLFVGNAPSLQSSQKIVWARVGEETGHGWGKNFLLGKQELPDVLDDRQGRFFLRVYNLEGKLLDSTTFRYSRNLLRIRVNGTDYSPDLGVVPTSSGHLPTEVRFVDADGLMIAPILQPKALQAVVPSGALMVPPNPNADCISCTLATDANGVDIVLNVPRVWWRLEGGRLEPGEWQDTPITMTREEFRKHAHSDVSVVLLSRRFKSACVGFDDEPIQPYRRLSKDDRIVIPLAHFVDHTQIDRRLNEDSHFNAEWAMQIMPLIVISADPMPEILSFTATPATIFAGEKALLEWAIRNAGDSHLSIDPGVDAYSETNKVGFHPDCRTIGAADSGGAYIVRPKETTRYTLTVAVSGTDSISSTVSVTVEQLSALGKRPAARVRSTRGGWRCGKGFSFRELQDAGMTVKKAVERSIPIDRRRRTSHHINVERVRCMG